MWIFAWQNQFLTKSQNITPQRSDPDSFREIGSKMVKILEHSQIKSKFCGFHFHCSEKPLTTSVLWKNFDQKVVSAGKWGMEVGLLDFFRLLRSFHFFFGMKFSFSEECLSIWIFTTFTFHSPKVHFHGGRGEWGCMKRKIVWGKVKHSYYFSAKTSLKFVSSENNIRVSFCPMFHTAPFTLILIIFHCELTVESFQVRV
jgi:hypothetical protein